jgi:probable selenium-dependent hydroxylase accessory protein YqeC
MKPPLTLTEALDIGRGDVVALVGGGGKTAALYRLGQELAYRGVSVVLSGTTRFTPPERGAAPDLTIIAPDDSVEALAPADHWPVTVATGHGSQGRLLPVEPGWVDELHARHPDWAIILEADGSAMRPFKAPATHEPVIPSSATLVVTVVGIDAAGRPLDDTHVHRHEIVAALAGAAPGSVVDEALMAAVLVHPDGGRKGVPLGARWVPLINKADTPERGEHAERLARLLLQHTSRVLVTRLRDDPPLVRVLDR